MNIDFSDMPIVIQDSIFNIHIYCENFISTNNFRIISFSLNVSYRYFNDKQKLKSIYIFPPYSLYFGYDISGWMDPYSLYKQTTAQNKQTLVSNETN